MSGLLVAMDGYIARLEGGVNVGSFGPINNTKLDITDPDPDQIIRPSFMRLSKGSALDSYNSPKPVTIDIEFDDCDPDLLSMALRGTPAGYTQTAKVAAATSVTAKLGKWVALGSNNLTAATVTGKTAGTDYKVDLLAGLFMAFPSPGTIADNATVSVLVSCPARTAQRIIAGTVPTLQLSIYGSGINLFTGKGIDLTVYQANVSPSGAVSWVSAAPIKVALKGTLVIPAGKTGPYEYIAYDD